MKTKLKIIISLLVLISGKTFSQEKKIEYSYDKNGNRISRKIVVSGPNPGGKTAAKQDTAKTQEQIAAKYAISVSPNPTRDIVQVSLGKPLSDSDQTKSYSLFLINNEGKILLKRLEIGQQATVDLSNFKAGMYYIKMVFNDGTLVYKIIKVE